jgi:hypothetical protein
MRNIGFATTIAALCLGVSLFAGTASAAEDAKAKEELKLKGIYGGVGFGAGFFDDPSDVEDAWRLHAWFRPWDFMSFEVGYIDAVDPEQIEDVDGLHLAGVPTLRLGNSGFDLFGKVGGFFNDDSEVAIGLGGAYHLPKNFGVRLDWDCLDIDDKDKINVLTLSLFYHLSTVK